MRNLFLFILCCLSTFSCVVDSGEEVEGRRTRAAYEVYNYTQRFVSLPMDMFYTAQYLDMYINAPTEAEKIAIEDKYFKNIKIRQVVDGYDLIGGYSIWKVKTGGNKLTDAGVMWELYLHSAYNNKIVEMCFIRVVADKEWNMKYESEQMFNYTRPPSCNFTLKEGEGERYWISGHGVYKEEKSLVSFQIIEPVSFYRNGNPLLSQGKFDILFSTQRKPGSDKILVELSKLGAAKITYRGITEIW